MPRERFIDDTHKEATKAQLVDMAVRLMRNAGCGKRQIDTLRVKVRDAPNPEAAYQAIYEAAYSTFPEPVKKDPPCSKPSSPSC